VGQFDKLAAMAPGVLDLIEKKGRTSDFFGLPINPYATLFGYYGASLGGLGDFLEGELFLEKGLRHATRIGDSRTLALVEQDCAACFYDKGDWKAVAEHSQKTITYSEEVKFLLFLAWGWGTLGSAVAYLGDPEAGRGYGEKGLKMHQDAGIEWGLSFQYLCLGVTYFQMDDLEHARGFMEEALKLSRKNNEKYFEVMASIFLGRILGRTETPDIRKAEECVLQGMKIADDLKIKPFYAQGRLFLGELYAHEGKKRKALENLKRAETMFLEMGMDYWLAEARKVLAGL